MTNNINWSRSTCIFNLQVGTKLLTFQNVLENKQYASLRLPLFIVKTNHYSKGCKNLELRHREKHVKVQDCCLFDRLLSFLFNNVANRVTSLHKKKSIAKYKNLIVKLLSAVSNATLCKMSFRMKFLLSLRKALWLRILE